MNTDYKFGAFTFFASKYPGELCGSNGLPLTPNSVTIYGKSQYLKSIIHPHLCEYLDIIRGKHERIIIVSEYYNKSLKDLQGPIELNQLKTLARQILMGLSYLNDHGICHRSLSPSNILLDSSGDVKLFNYGLYYMSNYGKSVSFPIGSPKYMSPEVLLNRDKNPSGLKADIWSLGIILAELALNKEFWADLKLNQVIRRILSLVNCSGTIFERLANEHNCNEVYKNLPENVKTFINLCLNVNLKSRPTPKQLLSNGFCEKNDEEYNDEDEIGYHIGFLERVSQENVEIYGKLKKRGPKFIEDEFSIVNSFNFRNCIRGLSQRSSKEIYYLWQLAGGDVYSELKRQGMIKSKPSILLFPNLILLEGPIFGEVKDLASILDLRVVSLPTDNLYQRLSHICFEAYYPTIEVQLFNSPVKEKFYEECSLPLIIREKNTEYQLHRIILFHRLLLGYPYKKNEIIKEAEKDVPPFFRGNIWASLLGVVGNIQDIYESIDKETPIPTDRQIEVDIPRCHQYNELLSSSEGHRKLKRVLKAWVISHPQYVYWQGLDSLCAPFLYLNFNNEAQAYACLSAFIPKYLHNFFLKDNSGVIQEYLAKFKHLIAFHDPELSNHLDSINFIPELFAIPWFLTVFSHVFPLHKIFHLWDRILLGDASFPLYIGLAVLKQLRDTLLSSGFNECILLFSDLPEIDIERCVKDSTENYNNTPRSITFRQHELNANHPTGNPELELTPLPIELLQKEFCPRVSAGDLLYLLDVNKYSEVKALTIDIRNVDEFNAGALPRSINIPFNTISLSETEVPGTREGKILLEHRGKIIVVVGSGGENLIEFCRWLVKCNFPKVCSLHGGIQVMSEKSCVLCHYPHPSHMVVEITTTPETMIYFDSCTLVQTALYRQIVDITKLNILKIKYINFGYVFRLCFNRSQFF